jgi:hypothetical protein
MLEPMYEKYLKVGVFLQQVSPYSRFFLHISVGTLLVMLTLVSMLAHYGYLQIFKHTITTRHVLLIRKDRILIYISRVKLLLFHKYLMEFQWGACIRVR